MLHSRKRPVVVGALAIAAAIGMVILGAATNAQAQSPPPGSAPEPMFRIHNRWQPAQYLNIEHGSLESSPIEFGWWSAQWFLESIPGTPYTRIRSRWRPDQYVNIEHGLASTPIEEKWWSAMWIMEPVEGTNLYRIRNRWHPNLFLNIEHGFLECAPIQDNWWSAMWSLEQ
jgi:hypothetical protein